MLEVLEVVLLKGILVYSQEALETLLFKILFKDLMVDHQMVIQEHVQVVVAELLQLDSLQEQTLMVVLVALE